MTPAVFRGALWAVALAFPLAAICAVFYRFPVPFSGYQTGLVAVPGALVAVVFYGILDGFPALLTAGPICNASADSRWYSLG